MLGWSCKTSSSMTAEIIGPSLRGLPPLGCHAHFRHRSRLGSMPIRELREECHLVGSSRPIQELGSRLPLPPNLSHWDPTHRAEIRVWQSLSARVSTVPTRPSLLPLSVSLSCLQVDTSFRFWWELLPNGPWASKGLPEVLTVSKDLGLRDTNSSNHCVVLDWQVNRCNVQRSNWTTFELGSCVEPCLPSSANFFCLVWESMQLTALVQGARHLQGKETQ